MDRSTSGSVDPEVLARTRRTLHGVAEHLLAGYSRRLGGSIRLHMRDGALSTADLPGPIGRLALDGGQVVRYPDGLCTPVTGTFGEIADALAVPFGMPDPPYPPASGCRRDDVAGLDETAVAVVFGAWGVGHHALSRFAAEEISVVWPEHLDLAVTVDQVNYGVSPGDTYSWRPYAYVGPHGVQTGPFWNAPFGAARPLDTLLAVVDDEIGVDDVASRAAAVHAFFREGQAQLAR
jgi:hypothetical protein